MYDGMFSEEIFGMDENRFEREYGFKNQYLLEKNLSIKNNIYVKNLINFGVIDFLKAKMDVSKNDILIQTDIDYFKFNKLIKNNNIIIMNKRLTSSKLINIVEKINYNTKFIQPIGKQSLLNLIPDLYRSKAKDNIIKENENLPKINFDEFFLLFMKEKFKLQKIVKKNAEKTIIPYLDFLKCL